MLLRIEYESQTGDLIINTLTADSFIELLNGNHYLWNVFPDGTRPNAPKDIYNIRVMEVNNNYEVIRLTNVFEFLGLK